MKIRYKRYFAEIISFRTYLVISLLICIVFILLFQPIVIDAKGDALRYIDLSKQLFNIPGASDVDLSHRSPFYSTILGLFNLVFGEDNYLKAIIVFQYIMVYISGLIIYKLTFSLSSSKVLSFIAALVSLFNLSTVFFAYNILTETTALLLFTLIVFYSIKYFKTCSSKYLIFVGIASGILVLTRFNMIGLPLVSSILIGLYLFLKKQHFKVYISHLGAFALPVLIVLNTYAMFNYTNRGFYGVLRAGQSGQRWAIPSTINERNIVSEEYSDILEIFLETRKSLVNEKKEIAYKKASLLNNKIINSIFYYFKSEVNGYKLYLESEEKLLQYYNLDYSTQNINKLGEKLEPFYREIAKQNRLELSVLRAFSFLYTFKYVSPILPGNSGKNLNLLPSSIHLVYKIGFILISVLAYFYALFHGVYLLLRKRLLPNYANIVLYSYLWYFPLVHVYANVMEDANRFKYPAESIIIIVFFIFMYNTFNKVIRKRLILVQF